MPSFSVIKQYYAYNNHGIAVSNTMVFYHGISTLEITGTFMENLMVIRVEVIAPEKPLLSKHLQK